MTARHSALARLGALPAGTRFLRLVVDSPGPLGAVAAPLEWAEVGTQADYRRGRRS